MRKNTPTDIARHLVSTIGKRPATSIAEAQAAAYIDGLLRRAGMKVVAETFQAPAKIGAIFVLVALFGTFAAALSGLFPLASFCLALFVVIFLIIAIATDTIALVSPLKESQNIVANRACEDNKQPRWRVVLLCPLDSPAQRTPFSHPALQRPFHHVLFSSIIALGMIALLSLVSLLRPWEAWWWYAQAVPTLYLLMIAFPWKTGIHTTLPSAGALSACVTIAEQQPALQSVELWVVALGATSTGNHGVQNFLTRYPFVKAETLFLSVENITNGTLTYASREGMLWNHRGDELLLRLVHASQDVPLTAHSYGGSPASLALPLYQQGYRVLTLITRDIVMKTHSQDEDALLAQVDDDGIGQVVQLVQHMLQYLDEES